MISKSTCSLIVISSPASNSATTCFSTSLVMEGSTCLSKFYFFLLLNALLIRFQSNTNINHPVVIILTKGGVNLWKGVRLRPEHSNNLLIRNNHFLFQDKISSSQIHLKRILRVMLTFCRSLDPVIAGTFFGLRRKRAYSADSERHPSSYLALMS